MCDNLPYLSSETFTEILQWLPVKSIVRCTSVCKSWRSLIINGSGSVIYQHFLLSSNSNPHFLVLRDRPYGNCLDHNPFRHFLRRDDAILSDSHSELLLPAHPSFRFDLKAISCGLVCLSDSSSSIVILCNPSLRRYIRLPEPRLEPNNHRLHILASQQVSMFLGFDSQTLDHKVVRLSWSLAPDDFHWVQIYSVATGVWRDLPTPTPIYSLCGCDQFGGRDTLGGIVFCCAKRKVDDVGGSWYYFVLSFDFGREVFAEVMLPESLAHSSSDSVMLSVVEGGNRGHRVNTLLTVCPFSRMINGSPSSCQIWHLTEFDTVQSWSNIYDFSLDDIDITGLFGIMVGGLMIRNRIGSLLIIVQGQFVYYLDLETQNLIQLPIGEAQGWERYPAYYVESLFLLDKLDGFVSY